MQYFFVEVGGHWVCSTSQGVKFIRFTVSYIYEQLRVAVKVMQFYFPIVWCDFGHLACSFPVSMIHVQHT